MRFARVNAILDLRLPKVNERNLFVYFWKSHLFTRRFDKNAKNMIYFFA